MDTLKVLLGATFGLLLALVVLAFTNLNSEKSSELERLRLENERLKMEKTQPAPVAVQPVIKPEVKKIPEETAKRMAELERQIQDAKKATERMAAAEAARLASESAEPEITEGEAARLEKRARQITNALVVGKVESFDKEFNFLTFTMTEPDIVVSGMTLAIRRNRGIAGKINVNGVEGLEGVGDPDPSSFFKGIDVRVGDELIVPPL